MACGFRDLGFGFRGRQLSLFLDIYVPNTHTHTADCVRLWFINTQQTIHACQVKDYVG